MGVTRELKGLQQAVVNAAQQYELQRLGLESLVRMRLSWLHHQRVAVYQAIAAETINSDPARAARHYCPPRRRSPWRWNPRRETRERS